MKTYRAGIDIGSTTVKLVILDENGEILFGDYRRHHAHTQGTLKSLLIEAQRKLGSCSLQVKITGSGSINLGKALNIGFVQEVVAVATALKTAAPQTDVAIELGGEDAKIIYFKGGLEERMNGVCAGGTGSFIDQMAALLQTDATGLNDAAKDYKQIYPIAARCGVFAKTDIQPLINEGATKADLAASIFQAVVNQTISGLACGKPIRGCVAFLGGPLHFLTELKAAFIRTLKLTGETTVDPDNSHLFAAMGAALESGDAEAMELSGLIERLENGVQVSFEMPRLAPLFRDQQEFGEFCERHSKAVVRKEDLSAYSGNCFLGIDAGSTTTKLVLIGEDGQLLYHFYRGNQGNPIMTAQFAIGELKRQLPETAKIVRACSTGYGEALLKSAFSLDEGVVETIAHCTAASFFDPEVDCVLDIGGQDMKCIKLKNGTVDTILLNEACSSGCGSFIENFATSLGYTAEGFAKEALFAKAPVDLGTRCTVFMNSNVKQAQKEGASVSDISAGLAYSVIKNALYKVIKLASAEDLGRHIVVQGGTFHNQAALRAFEKIAGVDATCPDISGLMGAFGAALVARGHYAGQESSMLSLDDILKLSYTTSSVRCGGCSNNCMLTINKFSGGRRHISGNRCEKGAGNTNKGEKAPNMVQFKRDRIFGYEPLAEENAPRGTIGIPRVLNMYENYPFWATFFKELGFRAVLSPFSDRKIYELGMESIPSESECYPAKLSHGHVQWLINQGIKTIFHPCVFYEHQEAKDAQNHYNCPIVVSYAENLKNNVEAITEGDVHYIRPFIAFTSEQTAADRLSKTAAEEWNIPANQVRAAVHKAWEEQKKAKADIRAEGMRLLTEMQEKEGRGIVLAGRPYHIDPEINHGIPELIASYGLTVFTEDSLPIDFKPERPLRVVDQWVYHSRLYSAAQYVSYRDDLELIQLNSFGCGLDAVTTDQVSEILEKSNKLYTLLKIDEVNNLGAVRIRIRSLLAAMDMRREKEIFSKPGALNYQRAEFTKQMYKEGYTILAPQMSPIHFDLLEPIFHKHGYNIVLLDNDNREAIDTGLKFVNNDACFPSITVVGQIMQAVLSGKYDTDRLAVIMTQTGGCCRASNYVAFIRRALEKAGLSHIPVISLNANGMEKNEGLKLTPGLLADAVQGVVYGDLMMRCLYRVRPYEKVPGSANALHAKWRDICIEALTSKKSGRSYKRLCAEIVEDFDNFPIDETIVKPRVGVVGEILVKYMPLANNHLVDLLEREGAEAVVPDLMDFLNYSIYNGKYKSEFLGAKKSSDFIADTAVKLIRQIRKPALEALEKSKRFEAPMPIEQIGEITKPFLSLGNQYGEGWFLTGEMIELIQSGVPNIVCIQPFACLPNHVVGKGVIKALKKEYPQANIAAVDYDPGASEVNQLNRIKLMLSAAKENQKTTV
ncbi:MAG: acyl-CoA dehydratase activase-related protein [Oscillospiraceae bacterium]|nr:acyl-CoA dehydratase activase-related protein [Oscillospiraceae bacterium]